MSENGTPAQEQTQETDWKAEARKWEERSKSNHSELQSAQTALSEAEGKIGSLTETVNELNGRVEAFEKAEARAKLTREIADREGIPADALRGDTEEELTAHARDLKKLFEPVVPYVPSQDRQPSDSPRDEMREFARSLFNSN